jgi:hypothetical protein
LVARGVGIGLAWDSGRRAARPWTAASNIEFIPAVVSVASGKSSLPKAVAPGKVSVRPLLLLPGGHYSMISQSAAKYFSCHADLRFFAIARLRRQAAKLWRTVVARYHG